MTERVSAEQLQHIIAACEAPGGASFVTSQVKQVGTGTLRVNTLHDILPLLYDLRDAKAQRCVREYSLAGGVMPSTEDATDADFTSGQLVLLDAFADDLDHDDGVIGAAIRQCVPREDGTYSQTAAHILLILNRRFLLNESALSDEMRARLTTFFHSALAREEPERRRVEEESLAAGGWGYDE